MVSEKVVRDFNQPPPKSEYEGAARAWTEAKEHLLAAQQRLAGAEMEASKAREDEAEAWNLLQQAAGRGPQKAMDARATRPYPPEMRG